MKKIINDVQNVLDEAFKGFIAAHGDLIKPHPNPNVRAVLRKIKNLEKVALVSGGGSGHEPLHAGFVGEGLLDAAVAGEIFTSPPADKIFETARHVAGERGVLFIVKNYTGDVINFQMASEMLKDEGIKTKTVIVSDDVAVKDSLYTAGRRGVAGTVMVEKIAGAFAETGASLDDVAEIARHVCENVKTMGVALSSCTVPAVGKPTFALGDDEIELGVGIHGEPGRKRLKLQSARELVQTLASALVEELPSAGEFLVFVNGLGGTPLVELYLVYNEAVEFLNARGMRPERSLVGNYVTSLDMQGCSLTLMAFDERTKRFWDAKCCAPAMTIKNGRER